jgi:cytochrome c
MPLDAPKSMTDDEAYALAAFILERNGIIDPGTPMTAETLPAVLMPNRDNFIDVWATQGEKPW